MKRVKLNGILYFFTILCLLVSVASAAAPAEDQIQPYYLRIATIGSDFSISSSGYARCYGYVELHNMTDTAELTVELQRSTNGSDWETIKDWTASDKCTVELDKGWYVASGYSYQIHITVKVYTSSGSLVETVTKDSLSSKY